MKKSSLALLTLMLASAVLARPVITRDNPLYEASLDVTGLPQNKFKIDYHTLVKYYDFVGGGLLKPAEYVNLMAKDQSKLALTKEDLSFEVNMRKMNIAPVAAIAPESAQDLFQFDIDGFMSKHPGEDFVTAKKKVYEKLGFNPATQHFDRQYLHMSDWKSLMHPPVKQLTEDLNRYYKDTQGIPENSRMLTTEFNREMDLISGSELTTGNKLKLLVNNNSFHEKMKRVKSAKKSILVGVMSFAADPSSFELIDALIEKKKQGVDVQIMLEKL